MGGKEEDGRGRLDFKLTTAVAGRKQQSTQGFFRRGSGNHSMHSGDCDDDEVFATHGNLVPMHSRRGNTSQR